MKKITFYLITACLLLTFYPQKSNATVTAKATSISIVSNPSDSTEAQALLLRLDEIKTMDKSNLNSPEKRSLRKEVRAIKSRLNELGDGVYISLGGAIIIILLLIIIF
ncbi:MAG: hypothetical protein K9J13_14485 [Saprospiraceae bacterium]|nr:hypothetical protein [Saprospiraceae bacterium]